MLIRKLQNLVVAALEDIKGRDIEVINTAKLSSMFERIVIASADSTRQVKALARHVQDKVIEAGGAVLSVEGEENGEWVLLDLGSIVVHVMQPGVRSYYNLEELWRTPLKKKGLPPSSAAKDGLAQPSASGGAEQGLAHSRLRPPGGGDEGSRRAKEVPAGRERALAGPSVAAPRRRRVASTSRPK